MELKKFVSIMLLIVAVSMGFSSCSDDDNPQDGISQILIGRWQSAYYAEADEVDADDLDVNDTKLNCDHQVFMVFNSDGTGHQIDEEDDTDIKFTYKIKGDKIYLSAATESAVVRILKYNDRVIYTLLESEDIIQKMVKRQ